jgi:hypothetical protein
VGTQVGYGRAFSPWNSEHDSQPDIEAMSANTAAKAKSLRMIRSLQTNSRFCQVFISLTSLIQTTVSLWLWFVSVSATAVVAWKLYTKINDVQPQRGGFSGTAALLFSDGALKYGVELGEEFSAENLLRADRRVQNVRSLLRQNRFRQL